MLLLSGSHPRAPAVPSMIQHIILEHLLCARLCTKHQGHRTKQSSQSLPSQSLLFSRETETDLARSGVRCNNGSPVLWEGRNAGGSGDMGQSSRGEGAFEKKHL